MSLGSDAFKKKLWTDRDYLMAIGYSTPYANLAGDTAAEYYVDLPGLFSTSTAPNILEPIIALIWGDAIYPVRTDRWEDWTPMYGYGPVNYWSWFSLKPVGE
ncbi:MAG: hypothetical protein A4E49_00166 [Methanosaeta sp. PtaU1.Bin112]|nr:MAG: hypothetical protein A4E49_00166 [Methanosaeta sp. PtaU1.Bin112]